MEDENMVVQPENFEELEKRCGFEISFSERNLDLDDITRFSKLEMTPSQKMQVSAMLQSIPTAATASQLSNCYTVSFPKGVPYSLTQLKQGGYGSMIRENGKFAGSASFHPMTAEAAVLGAFSAMSIATGQYFMAQINHEMSKMNRKMDTILEFLYGDKKAELISEISFVKYAYENYSSIMDHEVQKIATIGSLQQAKKIAIKDIEFYLNDLASNSSAESKNYAELEALAQKAFQMSESLELSKQLYIMSNVLEMQFAQNTDSSYIGYVEEKMISYLKKCDSRILSSLSELKGKIDGYKGKPMEKVEKNAILKKLDSIVEPLNSGETPQDQKAVKIALHASEKKMEYYASKSGDLYVLQV